MRTPTFNIVRIIPPPEHPSHVHSRCFTDVALVLRYGLEDLGYRVIFGSRLRTDCCNVVLGYHLLWGKPLPAGYDYIVYQLEQLAAGLDWQACFLDTLRSVPVIWDFSQENIAFLAEHDIRAIHKPIGFHPRMFRVVPNPQKDIDILFYGMVNERRKRILDELSRRFRTKVLVGVYGDERDAWISRAKIVLDIHYYEARLFDEVRLTFLLNNRVFTIVENTPHRKYEDFIVYADYDDLVDTCEFYLAHDTLRQEAAQKAFCYFSKFPEHGFLRKALLESECSPEPQLSS